MILMDCRHPDIFKFVEKKKDRTKVTGANISVMLTDEFMKAVKSNWDFFCSFPMEVSNSMKMDIGMIDDSDIDKF